MRDCRLILIEGIPGSGKSTLAQTLLRHFTDAGIPARWWYEEELGHPVYIFHNQSSLAHVLAELAAGRYEGLISRALDQWQRFVESIMSADTVVLIDSCLFGYLTWSFFPIEVPTAAIQGYLSAVEQIVMPAQPVLLHLYQEDVAQSLRRMLDSRGQDIEATYIRNVEESAYGKQHNLRGFAGLVSYWTAYQDLTRGEFARGGYCKLAIETSAGDWAAYEQNVLDFLELPTHNPLPTPPTSPDDLAWMTGVYSSQDTIPAMTCTIISDDNTLLVNGLPEIWPHNRLIPRGPALFDVASLPFTIRFQQTPDRNVCLTISGPELLGGNSNYTLWK